MTFKHNGVICVQYCLYGELYCIPKEIYGDNPDGIKEVVAKMAYSTAQWCLCDKSPSFEDNPMLRSELEYNQQIFKMNQLLLF